MPIVSVIMPAYNAEQFIAQAIESILNQTYRDFELLICDDGSADATYEIAKSYKDKRIRLFKNKKNIGNLRTTNFLFSQCTGEYIGIQDADDVCDTKKLELQIQAFEQDAALGIVGTGYMITDEHLQGISCGLLPTTNDSIQKVMEKEVPPLLYASVLVKKQIIEQVGYFRPIFNRKGFADLDWLYRICEITKAKNLKEVLYCYRIHNQQFTNLASQDLIQKHAHILMHEAHIYRLQKKVDFFDTKNLILIRSIIVKSYVKQAENLFWIHKKKDAIQVLLKSMYIFPFNLHIYKLFFYILRH